ncbi:hypothetical protein NA57DRAFT_75723 [Rhizodiscina lignyota]|uniref:Uncharacterized protein n=1 Tax=Rhizodiscina lignyota TaxID=1504668 RepID=A0A9P4IED8_9PEZI|nr:hypothetical protein NA57DRAFT_75723 [Rhizodiscina lignyota]
MIHLFQFLLAATALAVVDANPVQKTVTSPVWASATSNLSSVPPHFTTYEREGPLHHMTKSLTSPTTVTTTFTAPAFSKDKEWKQWKHQHHAHHHSAKYESWLKEHEKETTVTATFTRAPHGQKSWRHEKHHTQSQTAA